MNPNSARIQITLLGAVLLIAMAAVAAWTWHEPSLPPPVPGNSNLLATRVVRRPLADVQKAIEAFGKRHAAIPPASMPKFGPVLVPGESYRVTLMDCFPLSPKSRVPLSLRPLFMKLGWRPKPYQSYWQGEVEARSESAGRTRLSIFQRHYNPTNAIEMAQAYLDAFVAELKK